MPIYEYQCQKCHSRKTVLVRTASAASADRCDGCGSPDLVRVISAVSYHRSVSTVWEQSGAPRRNPGPDYYKDPRNIGRWTEKRFKDMGMELPREINQQIQAAREGELPKSLKDKL